MKLCLTLSVLLSVILVEADEGKYTSKFDNIDYKAILASERLLLNYYKCMMDEGPCTPDGKELKKVIPETLETECGKCTEKQKAAAKEIIHFMVNNKLELWKNLLEKYDPQGTYREKYQDEWRKQGYPL
ncbi:ejaculatory bulb-specific protein 3-like [Diorhabda carinulata]|uniref:ejaculatory bulb-specific protein 3-like n=1 Tax=Diorhabda sublineata TaxID=1163346 RepID=UPI0024E1639D|nr:ejaculatory bulb-specific protein 3-like [Diorhabda sublineata]XP_057656969.1 ejaculatory bulb-specific protein 3-like [Diorhabda carinulata]